MTREIEALIQDLKASGISPAKAEIHSLCDYTVDGIQPRIIVTPNTIEETARIVSLANHHRATVMVRGGGSHMGLGSIPDSIDILIETKRLNRLLEHEAPDLTCCVEVGTTLETLQSQLASKGQWLALDPPGNKATTIGGILATNASGPKRLRYGTARDQVIGLRVIQANGELARSGGRVVKNVAGYDLNKLYIGSLGTLGIIVEANFKLQPLPASERTLLLTYQRLEDAMQTVIALTGSPLTPSALELIDTHAARKITNDYKINVPSQSHILAVNFEGSPTTITRQIDETQQLARKYHASVGDELTGSEQEQFWQTVRAFMQGTITCKVAILVTQMARYLQQLEHVCRQHDLVYTVIAHAGNGILYITLQPDDVLQRLSETIKKLRHYAQAARGNLVVERCPTALKQHISIWGEPGNEFRLMQRLKQQFDQQETFVKGRFLGGL